MFHARIAMTLAAALVLSHAVAAADEATKPTQLTADFGYVQTSGNSRVTTITGGDKLDHHSGVWLFTQEASAVWGQTDGIESAARYAASLRGARDLIEQLSVYALAAWNRNTFAGIERRFDENVGLTWHAVTAKPNLFDVEAGVGLAQRRTTLEEDDNFSTARAGLLYDYDFSEKSRFEAKVATIMNLDDTNDRDSDGHLSLTAPVRGVLALKVSYDVYYRNKPLPGLEKTDTTVGVGIQAVF